MSIKFGPIFHVGYAVPVMDRALDYWTNVLGVGPFFVERHVTGRDEAYIYRGKPCEQDVTVAHAFTGDMDIELICPNIWKPSPVVDYLELHPRGGVQHFGVLIGDWDATMKRPEVQERLVLEGHAGTIRIAFVDSYALGAPALELIEANDETRRKLGYLKKMCAEWDGRDPIRGKK